MPAVFAGTRLDTGGVVGVVDYLIGSGVTALTALGIASEPWALTPAQRGHQLKSVVDATAGRVPVLAGIHGNLEQCVVLGVEAATAGVSHLLVRLPPEADRLDPARRHLERLQDETGLPLVLQDAPQVIGTGLTASVIRSLVEYLPTLVGVKLEGLDCGPDVSALADSPVPVIVGWGGINLPDRLMRGASGCMPGAGTAPTFVRIFEQWQTDQVVADETYHRLLPLLVYASQSLDLMIATTKRILRSLGIIHDATSVPHARLPDTMQLHTVDALIEHLVSTGVIPGNPSSRG